MTALPEPSLIPENPLIEALRAKLAQFDEHEPTTFADYGGVGAIIDAARAIVAEYDEQMAYVAWAMAQAQPTTEQIRERLGMPVNQDAP